MPNRLRVLHVAMSAMLGLATPEAASAQQAPQSFEVRGVVVDTLGTPVSGMTVRVGFNALSSLSPPEAGQSVRTDRAGRFRILVTGPCRVALVAYAGRALYGSAMLVLPDDSAKVLTIRLTALDPPTREP
jgi:hypothetical protein